MKDVVKVTVFIREHQDYGEVNEAYRTFFEAPYPEGEPQSKPALEGATQTTRTRQ